MTDDDLLIGDLGGVDVEEDGVVTLWGPSPEAITELACADWRQKSAPRFEEGEVVACHGHPNPDIWFSDIPEERVEAQSICLACPSRWSCSTQTVDEVHGIWAGDARDGKPIELKPDVCAEGHEDWGTDKRGWRFCRECGRIKARARSRARREAVKAA